METLVYFGTEVKAYDDGVVDGYLVQFGKPDISRFRDFFTKADTDFDIDPNGDVSAVYYHHGLDPVLKRKRLGTEKAQIGVDEVGVWIKTQLDLRDKYEAAVHQLAKAGKLGWSSGVPIHLAERKAIDDNAHLVTMWPLGKDASLTPIPADPSNVAHVGAIKSLADIETLSLEDAIKSLLAPPEAQDPEVSTETGSAAGEGFAAPETPIVAAQEIPIIEIITEDGHMTEEVQVQADNTPNSAMKTELDALKAANEKMSANFEAVLKFMQESPRIAQSGYFSQDGGTQDTGIKSAGDLMLSMARKDHKRVTQIYGLKAITEASGPNAGYYLSDQILTDLLGGLNLTSGIGSLVRRVPVSLPTGKMTIRDYSRTPSAGVGASASAQGIESQARAEGGAYTEETPYVEQIRFDVTDAASGYVKASRESIGDIPMLESMLRMAIEEDVVNKEEYFILRGNGAGQPLGVLNWSGTIGINEDTDNNFGVADMDEVVSRLLVTGSARVAWAYHHGVYTEIAALERGTGGAVMHNITGALPNFLSGHPQFMTQHLPAIGTSGYLVLGDWSKYLLFELGGLYIEMSEHADFLNGNTVWRFGKRIDGRPVLTSAVTMSDGTFTQSPFVKINNLS